LSVAIALVNAIDEYYGIDMSVVTNSEFVEAYIPYMAIPGAMNLSEVRRIEKESDWVGTGTKVSTKPSP